jgi:hypothetical protein
MNDETPMASGLPSYAERLVSLGSAIQPRNVGLRRSTWRALEVRAVRTRARVLTLSKLAAITVCAAAAVGLWRARNAKLPSGSHAISSVISSKDGWREIDLGAVGLLSLAPGTRVRIPDPMPAAAETYTVALDSGQLCARINHRDPAVRGPFVVEAPDLRVTVIGTRFCVFVDREPSRVSVEEGRVRVDRHQSEAVFVSAGEGLRADDPRLQPPAAAPVTVHDTLSEAANVRLVGPAHPVFTGDLAAQNRLYQAGLLAERTQGPLEALRIWEKYRLRYPRGAFVAEVDLRRVRGFQETGRAESALSAASDYPRVHPDDWRGNEVELIRADLLREKFSRPADALVSYRRVLATDGRTSWHERATYGAYRSLRDLSRTSDARVEARRYLERFPNGAHGAELRALLSSD